MAAHRCSTALAACALALGFAGWAQAEESADSAMIAAARGERQGPPTSVNFTDPAAVLSSETSVGVESRRDVSPRFANLGPGTDISESTRPESYELAVTANGPLDLSIAQRGRFGADGAGDLSRQGSGSEVRVGQGIRRADDERSNEPTWYVFAASDDEAVTWNPGARTEFGGSGARFALQDRVEIGDIQAGVTYEQNGIQASIAYVEREVSTRAGVQSFSHDENFAGVTVTMRR